MHALPYDVARGNVLLWTGRPTSSTGIHHGGQQGAFRLPGESAVCLPTIMSFWAPWPTGSSKITQDGVIDRKATYDEYLELMK